MQMVIKRRLEKQGDRHRHILYHPQRVGDTTKVSVDMEYPALFEPAGEGGFIVSIPDFGWGVSQGDTEDEALIMATALLQTIIQEHIRQGEALPQPSRLRGRKIRMIRLPALQTVKAELYKQS
jgi:predicted RNase H-like HicB family nuclease